MQSAKRKCDNPSCNIEAFPEQESKPYIPPYHWYVARGTCIGQARFKVEACSPTCLGKAVESMVWDKDE